MAALSLDARSAAPRLTGFRARARELMLTMQEGRMRGVLARMSDEELARIDLTRAEISDFARRAVRGG